MAPTPIASIRALFRSSFVLVGVLLVGVGIADMIAGGVKVSEYRTMLAAAPPVPREAPEKLFPTASEAGERRVVAQAKLGYYELLLLVGQLLAATGVILVGVGAVRLRLASMPDAPAHAPFR